MKKSLPVFAATAIAFVIGGCVPPTHIPPRPYDKETERQFDLPYQVSWDAVLDLVTNAGYKLDQVSKDSGYLSIARRLALGSTEADCGKFDNSHGYVTVRRDDTTANVAIRFKELPNERSQVRVVVTASRFISGTDVWYGSYHEYNLRCESTGELERGILDYVQNYQP